MADSLWKFCGGIHGCQEWRWVEEFRILYPSRAHLARGSTASWRAAYCRDCENHYDGIRRYDTPEEEPAGLHPEQLPGAILIHASAPPEPFAGLLFAAA